TSDRFLSPHFLPGLPQLTLTVSGKPRSRHPMPLPHWVQDLPRDNPSPAASSACPGSECQMGFFRVVGQELGKRTLRYAPAPCEQQLLGHPVSNPACRNRQGIGEFLHLIATQT